MNICLRELTPTDAPVLVDALNNTSVTSYLSSRIPSPYTTEDALWFINTGSKDMSLVKAISYRGTCCGTVGLYLQEKEYQHSAELGYWIAQEYWGNGLATLAVKAFVEQVFATTQITRVFNPVSATNFGSIRVMEKAGFTLEGRLSQAVIHNKKPIDELLFAVIKTD